MAHAGNDQQLSARYCPRGPFRVDDRRQRVELTMDNEGRDLEVAEPFATTRRSLDGFALTRDPRKVERAVVRPGGPRSGGVLIEIAELHRSGQPNRVLVVRIPIR